MNQNYGIMHCYCYAWTEINGQKGSSQVGYLRWSEPQSKCGCFINVWSGNVEIIEQKFLETGHTYM